MSDRLTVVTANLAQRRAGVELPVQLASLQWIVKQTDADVIGVQEAKRGLVLPGYRKVTAPAGKGSWHEPIFVKRRHQVTGSGGELIHTGASGGWYPKWLTWAVLDGWGVVLNGHVNSGIERRGAPNAETYNLLRFRLATKHIRRYRYWATHLGKPSIALGDFNVDAEADRRVRWRGFPAEQLALAGAEDARPLLGKATHGDRNIDRILHTPDLVAVKGRVLPQRRPHDHRFAVVTFRRREELG